MASRPFADVTSVESNIPKISAGQRAEDGDNDNDEEEEEKD